MKSQEHSSSSRSGAAIDALHRIKDLACRMLDCIRCANLDQLGELLHEGWMAKRSLSSEISNSKINRLYALARDAGALGGKITGAGGGGFLLLYCPPERQAAVRQAMAAESLQEMSFRFDHSGTTVLTNDPFLDGDRAAGLRWNFLPLDSLAQLP